MFRPIASSSPRRRWSGGALVSCAVHLLLVAGAVAATSGPPAPRDRPVERTITFHDRTQPPSPVVEPRQHATGSTSPAPVGEVSIPAPVIEIPTGLPDVDLSASMPRAEEWATGDASGGRSSPGTGSGAAGGGALAVWQVEQPAMAAPGSPAPRYPDGLRAAGVEGEAVVAFVVDTTGRVDPSTITVLRATHALFAAAVRQALPTMRFIPAEVDRRKVRQLVQQPFVFAISP